MPQSQKGLAHILLILIMLSGIAIAVYLTQFTQVFKPKAAGTNVFYVSPTGNDSNDGSVNSPFKTIEKARQAVRTINKSATTDIFVYIKKGTYQLDAPLIFDGEDSGFNGHYVRYISETQTDRPLIHGGKVITGWVQEGNKWKTNIGTTPIRHLYVNNERATRAKTDTQLGEFRDTPAGLIYADSSFSGIQNPGDMEVVISHSFIHDRCGVDQVSGTSLFMDKPCWDTILAWKIWTTVALSQPVWIENAYEFLDRPGEWYHNKQTGDLYYMTKSGEQIATSTIVTPKLEKLIEGKGTTQNPLHHIVFENLDFGFATYLTPGTNNGYIGLQGVSNLVNDQQVSIPGNIQFEHVNNVWLVRNGFYHLGAAGLNFGDGSKNNFVIGNVFNDISAHGIIFGWVDYGNTISIESNQIRSNYINNVGMEYFDAMGIYVGRAKNTYIASNEVSHVSYSGISVPIHTGAANVIYKNLVHNIMKGPKMLDGGGIYVKGLQPGSRVAENVIHSLHEGFGGLYLDGAYDWDIGSNVIYNILPRPASFAQTALVTGCGNLVHDNYWTVPSNDAIQTAPAWYEAGGQCNNPSQFVNNHVITSVSQAPQNIINAAGLEPDYKNIKNFPPPLLPSQSSASPSPSASASPGPSSVSSPSLSPKPGDTDNDGDVDIFDYNQVVVDFGKQNDPNAKGDVDNDNDVDIFDYNMIVDNFGS